MMRNAKKRLSWAARAALLLAAAGCARAPERTVSWEELIRAQADPERMARLDTPGAALTSSSDPAWGNNDYNHYLRRGPPGWWVIADLKGPGYLSRFWFTGPVKPHGLRLYFDGERRPRVDTTVQEFCQNNPLFPPPLAAWENLCWYNLTPIPYNRRLVVMVQEGADTPEGWPRLFYQLSSVALPAGTAVESYPVGGPTPTQRAALTELAAAWSRTPASSAASERTASHPVQLPPGGSAELPEISGPAVLEQLRFTPDWAAVDSAAARDRLLREVAVDISWDDLDAPSVTAPLGDLCGVFWRRTRYRSGVGGMTGDTLVCAWPMPFARRARVRLTNQGPTPVMLTVETQTRSLPAWSPSWGYLHTAWRRTGPEDTGKPHPTAQFTGAGKYVGCILSVSSLDGSWWLLEGDDYMFVDGEQTPSWRGTGLEDYFSGGWYYHNVLARPWHGLPFKAPFRTVQYRVHQTDPVAFREKFSMTFERGPNHASRGWMESLAFAYLSAPSAVRWPLPPAAARGEPVDPRLPPVTVTFELTNFERFDDLSGAAEFIASFLERHPDFPQREMLTLRRLAYRELLEGWAAAADHVSELARNATDPAVRQQAQWLTDFHADPDAGLLGLFSNRRTKIFLDGAFVGETRDDAHLFVFPVRVPPGRHVLAVQQFGGAYPDWAQAYLRTRRGDVWTTSDWKCRADATGDWMTADYDDRDWKPAGGAVKGPPEEPWVRLEPNAMVFMSSRAKGIRTVDDLPPDLRYMVFRHVFELPAGNP